ncbi:MAG: GIY-YIG nuclease family protein [Candidatus Goldbacteria bacterium]|nr:GIY-YIG nuclease family protein [Candidatus Goldiibacteriota bacterium]
MDKKSGQLVCQYLENISSEIFEKYQKIIKEYVKHRYGIYALYNKNGRVYYAGLASNLKNRLNMHLRDKHSGRWERFSIYLTISNSHLKDLETLVLRIANPKGNIQKGKFIKAENLQKKLKNDLKEIQKFELQNLLSGIKRNPESVINEVIASGRTPVLKKYVNKKIRIKMEYKGKIYWATILRDGRIRFRKKIYTSPSLAAVKISRHAMDGWHCWQYQRSPGEWVKLDELRKR